LQIFTNQNGRSGPSCAHDSISKIGFILCKGIQVTPLIDRIREAGAQSEIDWHEMFNVCDADNGFQLQERSYKLGCADQHAQMRWLVEVAKKATARLQAVIDEGYANQYDKECLKEIAALVPKGEK
jgi:hypothetical protein